MRWGLFDSCGGGGGGGGVPEARPLLLLDTAFLGV